MKIKTIFATLTTALIVSPAFGAVTFVDATTSNTGPGSAIAGSSSTDGTWRDRGFSIFNNGLIFEAYGASEDVPEITTSVAVANGTYNVYVFFWQNGDYRVDAGLTSGSLTTFASSSSPLAGTLTFADPQPKVDATAVSRSETMHYGLVGQTTVTDGTLELYVDAPSTGSRTWYEGVGYEAAPIPEPSTALLGGLGLLALLRRRR